MDESKWIVPPSDNCKFTDANNLDKKIFVKNIRYLFIFL